MSRKPEKVTWVNSVRKRWFEASIFFSLFLFVALVSFQRMEEIRWCRMEQRNCDVQIDIPGGDHLSAQSTSTKSLSTLVVFSKLMIRNAIAPKAPEIWSCNWRTELSSYQDFELQWLDCAENIKKPLVAAWEKCSIPGQIDTVLTFSLDGALTNVEVLNFQTQDILSDKDALRFREMTLTLIKKCFSKPVPFPQSLKASAISLTATLCADEDVLPRFRTGKPPLFKWSSSTSRVMGE